MIDETALLRRRLAGAEERATAAESSARLAKAQLAKTVLEAARTQDAKGHDQHHSAAEYHADMHALIEELAATKLALANIEKNVEVSRVQIENNLKSAHAQELEDLAKLHNAALNAQKDRLNRRLASAVDDKVSEARTQWEDELALQIRQAENRAEKTLHQRKQEWQAKFNRMATTVQERNDPETDGHKIVIARDNKKPNATARLTYRTLRTLLWIALIVAVLFFGSELFPDAKPSFLQVVDRWIGNSVSLVRETGSATGQNSNGTPGVTDPATRSAADIAGDQRSLEEELRRRIRAFKAGADADAAQERRSIEQRVSAMRTGLDAAETRAATAEISLTETQVKLGQEIARMRQLKAKSDDAWRSTVARLQEQIRKLRAQLAAGKAALSPAVDGPSPGSGFGATE